MQDLHDKTGTKFRDLLHSLYLAEEGFRNSKRVMGPEFSRPLKSFSWNSADWVGEKDFGKD